MQYQRSVSVQAPYPQTVAKVRSALAAQGFGVLSEIDVRATLRDKRGLEIEDYLLLGACNPDLAHRALSVERDVGVFLPCTVVVRAQGEGCVVSVFDPQLMAGLTGQEELAPIAEEAALRLYAALDAVAGPTP